MNTDLKYNFMSFWKEFKTAEVVKICDAAGTKFSYYKHLAYKRKYPRMPLAKKLVEASGNRLSLDLIFDIEPAAKG